MKQNETKQLFSVGHSRIVTLTLSVLFPFIDPIIFALNLELLSSKKKKHVSNECLCVCFCPH